jgi:hypothetical protein
VNQRKVESARKGGVALAGRLYIAFNPVTLNVTFDTRERKMVMRPALLFPFFSTPPPGAAILPFFLQNAIILQQQQQVFHFAPLPFVLLL